MHRDVRAQNRSLRKYPEDRRLASILQHCYHVIGHDSGITHLAAALGLPGLVLWGPTMETVWRPLGDRMKLLRAPAGLRSNHQSNSAADIAEP
jgi:ADP-heptose:LPS heptosyltransferase